MTLHYVSLFSGIEAFSVAASRVLGVDWRPVFFSEIDSFPCALLAHHYPAVPNLGDISKIKIHDGTATNGTTTISLPRTEIDILAGGSPCQDVSIAGRRAGMADGSGTRSSLAFEYARLVDELHPRIILWENVPGVLSSRGGLDFAAFLHSLVERGYSLAYRVLDAQYVRVDGFPRAVPQRRKRVWLIGCLGANPRAPAQILFERPGLLGDTPPRRATGQGFTAPAGYCTSGHDSAGGASRTLTSHTVMDESTEDLVVSAPLCAADGKGKNGMDILGKCAVVEEGCLTPEQPQSERVYATGGASPTIASNGGKAGLNRQAVLTYENHAQDSRVKEIDAAATIGASRRNNPDYNPLVVCKLANTKSNGSNWDTSGESYTLDRANGQAIALCLDAYNQSASEESCMTLCSAMTGTDGNNADPKICQFIGFMIGPSAKTGNIGAQSEQSPTLDRNPKGVALGFNTCASSRFPDGGAKEESAGTLAIGHREGIATRSIVRRLTPVECERLQGFPDEYTRIPYRGKPAEECPDSPRYKALGNSWATNCAEWILRRIAAAIRLGII